MSDTPNLKLPYMLAAQAQKHVMHNEALRMLDALVQIAVIDRDLTAPPGAPVDGARYIVAAGPTGAWLGHATKIAAFQDGAWMFYAPKKGWLVWVNDENAVAVFDGLGWALTSGGGGGGGVTDHGLLTGLADDDHPHYLNAARGDARYAPIAPTTLGINATADTTNRLAVSSPATLLNNAGAGHQVKVNKAAASDTASFLFQTGFSGRAEFGTVGDDNFRFKVSANGSSWTDAMQIDRTTGNIGINTSPQAPVKLAVSGAIQAGNTSAPNGCVLLKATYDANPAQAVITERGSGALGCTAYMYQDGSTTWLSSFAYGAIGRCVTLTSPAGFRVLSAPDQDVAPGSALTTQPTEKFKITSAGSVGIGVSTPSYQLQLSTDSAAKPSTNTWTVASDARLKTNIIPADLQRCWDIVRDVPLKRYTWKTDAYTVEQVADRSKLGWIAQDVQPYFGNAVIPHAFQCPPVEDGTEGYEDQETAARTVERETIAIEVRDGQPVQVRKLITETVFEPVFDDVAVVDEDGAPVVNEDGTPLTHRMPRMVTKSRPKMRVDTINDCLSLNSDQLYAAMYGALQLAMQRIEVLEGKTAA